MAEYLWFVMMELQHLELLSLFLKKKKLPYIYRFQLIKMI